MGQRKRSSDVGIVTQSMARTQRAHIDRGHGEAAAKREQARKRALAVSDGGQRAGASVVCAHLRVRV